MDEHTWFYLTRRRIWLVQLGWGNPCLSSQQVGQDHKVRGPYQHEEQWVMYYRYMYQTPIPALTSISSEITRFPDILQLPWSMGFTAKIKWNIKKSSAFIQKTVAPASYCTQQKLQPFSHVPLSSRQPIWMFCHEGVLMNVGLASSHDLTLSVSSVPIPQR